MCGSRVIVSVMLGLGCLAASAVGPTGEIVRLKGHTDAVLSAAISADGQRVVSGSNDHTAIIWDVESGKALQRLVGHAFGVTSVGFSADGGRVVTGGIDHTARVWDAKTGELLAILNGVHKKHVHGVSISPDGKRVLTASCDYSVVLWDVATERPVQTYRHAGEAHAVAFSPDGKTFLSGCRPGGNPNVEKNLRLYDATTGKVLDEFEIKGVDEVAYVNGGKGAVMLGLWELSTLDIEARKLTPAKIGGVPKFTLGASGDGRRILFGGPFDTNLIELDAKRPSARSFKGTSGEMTRVTRISPDGTWGLIAGGGRNDPWGFGQSHYEPAKDSDIRIVSLVYTLDPARSGPNDPRLAESPGPVVGSADGRRLLTFYHDGSIVWWDSATGQELARTKWERLATLTAMSADGARAAIAGSGGTITGYDGYNVVGTVRDVSDHEVWAIAPGPDAGSVFVGGWRRSIPQGNGARATALETEVHHYSLKDGREIRTFKGPVGGISALMTSPDGRTVVALCSNRNGGETAALAWDIASGRELWRWKPLAEPEKCLLGPLVIDQAGGAAAFVFRTKVVVLDMASGKPITELLGNAQDAKLVAFDPDGKRIWTVGRWDVRTWDRTTGAQIVQIKVPMKSDQWALRFAGERRLLIEAVGKKLIEHDLDP
ncbi:MAG: (Myosin heavy-chain) kinase Histone acetyltransferase [Phycisphaerales bacterium]|nr:(Myosin heavy-chain) kinase Histone acetyltransferase [Phycisphaerales bacterium]